MNCEAYIILLDEYLNNELESELRDSVSAHLDDCRACRAESRLLERESSLYRQAARHDENNFSSDWETMRRRLAAPTPPLEDTVRTPFAARFFARLENPFFAPKPVFGVFLLIALGALTLFFLNAGRHETLSVASIAEENAAPRPEDKILPVERRAVENDFKPFREAATDNSAAAPVEKNVAAAAAKRNSGSLTKNVKFAAPDSRAARTRNSVKAENANFNAPGSRPAENTAAVERPAEDARQLVSYLNKVHLFLLMIRNLENDRTINAVIGDKYQTEARLLLRRGGDYKQASRRDGNIPAVELLSEIEPLLRAISDLDEQTGGDRIGGVSALVKESGAVFKIRLWMSNARAARSPRGDEKR